MKIELIEYHGSDLLVCEAAWVSTNRIKTEASQTLIEFLMKNKHASPFEHCGATFVVEAPIFVFREWMRHRTQSFNELSGRYTEIPENFYKLPEGRPVKQAGSVANYTFETDEDFRVRINSYLSEAYEYSWDVYVTLLADGVAREVARMVLPVGIYSKMYVTSNLRNWLNFLVLRTAPEAMFEIRQLANQVEEELVKLFPLTMESWSTCGRLQL